MPQTKYPEVSPNATGGNPTTGLKMKQICRTLMCFQVSKGKKPDKCEYDLTTHKLIKVAKCTTVEEHETTSSDISK
jgi:hypothetical protein